MVLFAARDQRRLALICRVIVLIVSFACPSLAVAQKAQIRSVDRNQEIVHDLRNESQTFQEVRWDAHNIANPRGVVLIWTIEAFELAGGRNKDLADAGVALRIQKAEPAKAWKISQASDQTNVARGDRSASVSAVCTGHGQASMGLLVSFRTSAMPAAGRYRTKLVGTMTAP